MAAGKRANAKTPPAQKAKKKADEADASTTETQAAEAQPGSNSALSEDEQRQEAFHKLRGELAGVDAALARAKSARRETVQRIKKNGFLMRQFAIADQLETDEGEHTLKQEMQQTFDVARWLGVPFGSQMDMFSEPDRTPSVDIAAMEGRRDALAGKPAKPSYSPELPQYKAYLDAYHDVNERRVKDGIKKLTPLEQHAETAGSA